MYKSKNIFISVIICTFNRPQKLKESLFFLKNQELFEGDYEIIVIDNNPLGTNKEVIEKLNFEGDGGRQIKYFHKEIRGKGFALNTGIKNAVGQIITFIDEDNIPTQNYLKSIYDEFRRNGSLFVLTGKILLRDPDVKPLTTKYDDKEQEFRYPSSPWRVGHGSNLSIKKEVIDEVGFFDVSFGPGTFSGSAEDTDMIYRILKKGYKINYSPNVLNYHDHGRVTEYEVDDVKYNYAKGRGAFYTKHVLLLDKFALRMSYWELRTLTRNYVKNIKERNKNGKKEVHKTLKGLFTGAIYSLLISILGYRHCINRYSKKR